MFQKGFKKGALPARKVSPLMPINCPIKCLINSEQIVFNPCSTNQFVFQKMKAALMKPFMSILGEERGKSTPKKPTILSVFSAIRH